MIRRILSAVTAAILLTAIPGSALPALGAKALDGSTGGAVPAEYFDSALSAASADYWVTGEGTSSAPVSDSGEIRIYSATGTASVAAEFPDKISAGGYREVGIYARSLSEKLCTAVLTVRCGNTESSVTVQIPTGEEYYVFTPLPEGADLIDSISFSASVSDGQKGNNNGSVSVMIGGALLSDEDHTATAEKYSAFEVDGIGADGTLTDTHAVIGSPVMTDEDGALALRVSLRGNSGGFSLRFAPDGENFGVYGSAVISEDRGTYLFPVDGITPYSAYRLEFTGISEADVHVDGVDFIPVREKNTYDSLGSVSKCTLSDGTVSVSGSITRDAAVKYIDGEVCLYEIPVWQDVSAALTEEPALSIKMSTSFSFTLSITEDYSAFTSYCVAIRDSSGVHPLCDPIYPSTGHLPASEELAAAALGISPEDAFSAGFEGYVIDIDISTLFLDSIPLNSSAFTYDGYPYYPDSNFTSELGNKIQFLSSAGIGVIFRLSTDGEFSVTDATDCRRLAAAVAYLHRMYEPYGFIDALHYGEFASLSDEMYRKTAVARLISAAAQDCAVFIPVDGSHDGETAAWLLAKYISDLPKADLRLLLTDTNDYSVIGGITACAADGGYTSAVTVMTDPANTRMELPQIVCFEEGERPDTAEDEYPSHPVSFEWNEDHGVHTLWDFTGAYHTGGFTVPAGPTGIYTETNDAMEDFTGIPACRTLTTVPDRDSYVLMAEPAAPMDLSGYPSVRFLMSVDTESALSLDIVFISGGERAVFTASFDGSGVYAPVCDLSLTGISHKVDRIAIVLRESDGAEIGIATVTAAGDGSAEHDGGPYITEPALTTDTVEEPTAPEEVTAYKAYLAVGMLTVITLFVFAALSRRRPTE